MESNICMDDAKKLLSKQSLIYTINDVNDFDTVLKDPEFLQFFLYPYRNIVEEKLKVIKSNNTYGGYLFNCHGSYNLLIIIKSKSDLNDSQNKIIHIIDMYGSDVDEELEYITNIITSSVGIVFTECWNKFKSFF
ncbi:MAG: hypothetical protein Terrestrivirus2_62 [Terrestrivirus sp.]|uniref:Uncharacterized protein n=1 Tax=Terrestrivirus sp. TaxID=2487775 RepID=A0A3G4ZMB7_9VIRU|nr:MAG: hypothetical protein Terrestrivirus2_62 [Terrestrivirus sp.]